MKIKISTAVVLAALATSARGADITWTGGTSADWNTASNWNPADIPDTTTERAVFDGTGSQNNVTFGAAVGGSPGSGFNGILMTSNQTADLTINSTVSTTNFRMSAASGITIEAGAGAFSMGTSGSNIQLVPNTASLFTFQNDSSNTATLGNRITSTTGGGASAFRMLFTGSGDWQVDAALTPSGGGGTPFLTKEGSGTLTLTGSNTYTGGTTINGGTLALGTSGTLGGATSTITVDAGNSATLDLLGTADKTITSGTITLNAGSQLTITRSEFVAATQSATSFTGALSGAGNLVIGGLSGAVTGRRTRFASSASLGTGGAFDNFSGDITVQSGANLALFNGTLTSANSNNLTVDSGGYVTLLGDSTTFVGALSGGGFITRNNGAGTTATLSVASGNFSGVISQTLLSGGGTVALTKTGNGTLTLSGANTYAGATQVNAGELAITGSGSISSSSAITIDANATFRESSSAAQTFGAISGGGDFIRDTTNTGLKTFSGNNSDFTGTMTLLTGQNLFSGANAGSAAAAFTTGSGGATGELIMATGTYTINFGSLSGNGNFRTQASGSGGTVTASIGALNTDTTYGGVISQRTSVLALTKVGTGKLTLDGANTYTGTTTVNGGTLLVNNTHTAASGGAYSVGASGKLGGTGTITTPGAIAIAGQITGGDFGTVGTLSIAGAGSRTLSGTYLFDVNYSGMTGDLISITGAASLDLSGSTFAINELNPGDMPAAGSHYAIKIFESNVANGGAAPTFTLSDEGLARGQSIVTWDGGKTYYLVPEPASFALLGLGCLLLLRRPTRRRSRQAA